MRFTNTSRRHDLRLSFHARSTVCTLPASTCTPLFIGVHGRGKTTPFPPGIEHGISRKFRRSFAAQRARDGFKMATTASPLLWELRFDNFSLLLDQTSDFQAARARPRRVSFPTDSHVHRQPLTTARQLAECDRCDFQREFPDASALRESFGISRRLALCPLYHPSSGPYPSLALIWVSPRVPAFIWPRNQHRSDYALSTIRSRSADPLSIIRRGLSMIHASADVSCQTFLAGAYTLTGFGASERFGSRRNLAKGSYRDF